MSGLRKDGLLAIPGRFARKIAGRCTQAPPVPGPPGRFSLALGAEIRSVHLSRLTREGDAYRAMAIVVSPTPHFAVTAEGIVRHDVAPATKLIEQWPKWRESRSQPYAVKVLFRPSGERLAWLTVADLTIPVPLTDDWHTLPGLENFLRIGGPTASHQTYLLGGVIAAWKILQMGGSGPMLDWGVGTGRVAVPLRRLFDVDVVGVDVDEVNVRWCQDNLSDVRVSLSTLYPPLDYPDDHFTTVYGISVMSHLPRDVQSEWLREIRRILRPGGRAILTVHGDYAIIQRHLPKAVIRSIRDEGISDHERDDNIAVSEPGYYRSTYQLREQVEEAWSPIMPIVEYLPTANAIRQDYVVLRKGSEPPG